MPKEQFPQFVRGFSAIRLPLIGIFDQAGAISMLVNVVAGFVFTFEKMLFLPDVAGVGAGATQTFRLRKGNASGIIIDTITITVTNHVMVTASGVPSTGVTPANDAIARVSDTEGYSITKDAGTIFTAAGGTLLLQFRQKPQSRL